MSSFLHDFVTNIIIALLNFNNVSKRNILPFKSFEALITSQTLMPDLLKTGIYKFQ